MIVNIFHTDIYYSLQNSFSCIFFSFKKTMHSLKRKKNHKTVCIVYMHLFVQLFILFVWKNRIFHLCLALLTINCTVYFKYKAFCLHVLFSVHCLNCLLWDVYEMYDRLRIPHNKVRLFLLYFGNTIVIHTVITTFLVYTYSTYIEMILCLFYHCTHIMYVKYICYDTKYNDSVYCSMNLLFNFLQCMTVVLKTLRKYDESYIFYTITTEIVCFFLLKHNRK